MKQYFFLVLTSICFACNHSNETKDNDNDKNKQEVRFFQEISLEEEFEIPVDFSDDLTLEEDRIINIPIDETSLNVSLYPGYLDVGDDQVFITSNRHLNSIDFYSLKDLKLRKRVAFEKEGAEGIWSSRYYYAKSIDSIFIYSGKTIFLTNSQSKIIDKFSVPEKVFPNLKTHFFAKFFEKENKLYFAYLPRFNPIQLKDSLVQATFDLKRKEFTRFGARYTKAVTSNVFRSGHVSPRISKGHGNSSVVRFGASSSIFHINHHTGEVNGYTLRSKYHTKPVEPPPKVEGQEIINEDLEYFKDCYFFTLYDPYRFLYYSVFSVGEPPFDEVTGDKKTLEDRQMSVIIADTSFNYKGEVLLEKGKYFRSMIVTRDGLLVSNAHEKSPHFKEDVLSFTLFKIKKK